MRERREDIPLLARHFADRQAEVNGLPRTDFSADALNFLSRLPYLGNIRELKNLVERTILVSGKPVLDAADFDAQYLRHDEPAKAAEGTSFAGMTLDEIERQTILQALEQHKGNLSQVAVSLGISRAALYRRLENIIFKSRAHKILFLHTCPFSARSGWNAGISAEWEAFFVSVRIGGAHRVYPYLSDSIL